MAIVCLACNQDLVIASLLLPSRFASYALNEVVVCLTFATAIGCGFVDATHLAVVSLKQAAVYSFEGTDVLPLLSVVFADLAFGRERQNPDLRFRQQQMG